MINTIACISSFTDALVLLNTDVKVPSCPESHFTLYKVVMTWNIRWGCLNKAKAKPSSRVPPFLAHIYLLMYMHLTPPVVTILPLQRFGLNSKTVPCGLNRSTNPQESITKVFSGMDGSRNWNCAFNLERKSTSIGFLSSEVRGEREGLNCFKVRFKLDKPQKLPWIHIGGSPAKTLHHQDNFWGCPHGLFEPCLRLHQASHHQTNRSGGNMSTLKSLERTGKRQPAHRKPEGSVRQKVTSGLLKIPWFSHVNIYIPKRISERALEKAHLNWA